MHKRLLTFVSVVLTAAIMLSLMGGFVPVTAQAKSSTEIKKEIQELEQQKKEAQEKLDAIQKEADANLSELQKILAEKDALDQEMFHLQEQVKLTNDQITAYSALIADKQEELTAAQNDLANLQKLNKARLRAMEKNGKISPWSVIFKANSFSEMLDRLKMVEQIDAADRARMVKIKAVAQEVAEAKDALEVEKDSLEETRKELGQTEATLQVKRQEAEAVMVKLQSKREEFEELHQKHEESLATIKKQILDKEEQYDAAKDREYQEWLAQNPPAGNAGKPTTDASGKTWLTPTNYYYVSSPFGMRWHPVHGGYRMHNGVDLAADTGTPIIATRGGVVNTASFEYGGAGYYVFIDHKDGYQSCYMHMTHYIVKAGQYVYAGQVIGYVGSTGASNGPHLHFGIYKNWSAVNPADYIKF